MRRADLLARLSELKPWLEAQGVCRVRLFGSHARDEAREDSDVDLLVELSRPMGLEFFALEKRIADKLGMRVDLVTEAELARDVAYHALKDAVDA